MTCRDCKRDCHLEYVSTLLEERRGLVRCPGCYGKFQAKERKRDQRLADKHFARIEANWRREILTGML